MNFKPRILNQAGQPVASKAASPQPPVSHETACHNFAAGLFGVHPSQMSPAEFWTKLSDEFQADVSAFVTKWPPGQSKARGCYRVTPPPEDPDSTTVKPL